MRKPDKRKVCLGVTNYPMGIVIGLAICEVLLQECIFLNLLKVDRSVLSKNNA